MANFGGTKLEGADIGVIVAYFAIVLAFGIWVSDIFCINFVTFMFDKGNFEV